MQNKDISLKGEFVILRSVNKSDFAKIIEWRNNPEINRYLNQPYKLTLELQSKWYKEKYLNSNDILFVMIEQKNGRRIGTIGINDLDYKNRIGIIGRLLIGEKKYRGSVELIEANLLLHDYSFYTLQIEKLYGHVVVENKKVISFDKKFGFIAAKERIFPQYCNVNEMKLIEMVNTREQYENARKKIVAIIKVWRKQFND